MGHGFNLQVTGLVSGLRICDLDFQSVFAGLAAKESNEQAELDSS